eukprot:gene23508-biopygen7299
MMELQRRRRCGQNNDKNAVPQTLQTTEDTMKAWKGRDGRRLFVALPPFQDQKLLGPTEPGGHLKRKTSRLGGAGPRTARNSTVQRGATQNHRTNADPVTGPAQQPGAVRNRTV